MDRLFLDANVLFSAAYREQAPLRLLWDRRAAKLITSHYAVAEAHRHLDEVQRARLTELLARVSVVGDAPDRSLPPSVVLRAKDSPILAAALFAGATHLITGDRRDFGRYYGQRVGGVLILPPRDYLAAKGRRGGR